MALEIGAPKDTLAERILSEEQMQKVLVLETNPTRHLLIRILYSSGGRVSEVCALKWRDAIATSKGRQFTIVGKGGDTRIVKLKKQTWAEL